MSFTLTAFTLMVSLLVRGFRPTTAAWHPAGFWLLPFLAYAAVNVVWISPVPWLGWADWFGWAQMAAVFWLALNHLSAAGPRRVVHGTMAALGVMAVAMAAYQTWIDSEWLMLGRTQSYQFEGRASGPFGIPNSLAAFLLLLLPPAFSAALDRSRPFSGGRALAAVCAFVFGVGLLLTVSRGAWLAFAVVLMIWPLVLRERPLRWRLALSGGACLALALGAWVAYAAVPNVKARVDALVSDGGERTRPLMWQGAWDLFTGAPLMGTGAGSYNVLFERHRRDGFRDDPQWAHNDYLNTLSDYGLAGFLLAFGLPLAAACLLRKPGGDAATRRPFTLGMLGFGLTLLLDFHLKIPALAMTLAVAAAAWCRSAAPANVRPSVSARWSAWPVFSAVGVLVLFVFLVWPESRAEAARYAARRALDRWAAEPPATPDVRSLLANARASFERATALHGGNAQAWSDLAYVHSLAARVESGDVRALGIKAESAARKALEISPVVTEFWWRLGVALDMQGRWEEAGDAFAHALALAPHHPLSWYYQAYHFSLNPATRALARPALATCLRLDPGYRPAESLWEVLKAVP